VLVCGAWFGLSNRIKVLASCMRAADLCGRELRVLWPLMRGGAKGVDFTMTCPLDALFAEPPPTIDEDGVRTLGGRRVVWDGETIDPEDDAPTLVVRHTWRWVPLAGEPFVDLERRFEDPGLARQRDALLPYLRRLRPKASITAEVADFAGHHRFEDGVVGLHVRRGDHARARAESPDAAFFVHLDAHPGERLFLTTDDHETEARFRARYGARVIVREKATLDRADPASGPDALIDLLLLARTQRLVGSAGSSFTELAWWLAGCAIPLEIAEVTA